MTKMQTTPATAADPTAAAADRPVPHPGRRSGCRLSPSTASRRTGTCAARTSSRSTNCSTRSSTHAQDGADLAAERIVALGLPIDARLSTVAEKAARTAVPAGFTQWEDMIRGVIADMDAVLVDVKAAIDGLDEIDLAEPGHRDQHPRVAREGPLVPVRAPRGVAHARRSPRSPRRGPSSWSVALQLGDHREHAPMLGRRTPRARASRRSRSRSSRRRRRR